jgi:hypothetical protein
VRYIFRVDELFVFRVLVPRLLGGILFFLIFQIFLIGISLFMVTIQGMVMLFMFYVLLFLMITIFISVFVMPRGGFDDWRWRSDRFN